MKTDDAVTILRVGNGFQVEAARRGDVACITARTDTLVFESRRALGKWLILHFTEPAKAVGPS